MRDGTTVTVVGIIDKFDRYWQRDMPYVRLSLPTGSVIERRTGTVESYLLEDLVKGEPSG